MADAQPTTEAPSNPAQTGQTNIQVNLDYLKTTRVHMCMPCYGGQLTEQTFMSYIRKQVAVVQTTLSKVLRKTLLMVGIRKTKAMPNAMVLTPRPV